MKSIDEVVIRIELDSPVKKGDKLASYWDHGGACFEALKKNKWIDEKGDILIHFKMDEVKCLPKENGKYEVAFRYYLVND